MLKKNLENYRFKTLINDVDIENKPKFDPVSTGLMYNNMYDKFNKEMTIEELKTYIKGGRCFSFGDWEQTTERVEKWLIGRNLIWLDFDGCYKLDDMIKVIDNLDFYCYLATSSSHQKKGKDKFKIFIPLSDYITKEDYSYNVSKLVEALGCIFEVHIMSKIDGKKEVVQNGVDPASKKYNQICYGFSNKDKTNFFEHENNSTNIRKVLKETKEIKISKEKVKKEIEKKAIKVKSYNSDLFYEYPLHVEFANGNLSMFNEENTYQNLFEVASNYSVADKEEEFKELLALYPRRNFGALKGRFGKNNDSYFSEDYINFIIANKRVIEINYDTEFVPDYFFFYPLDKKMDNAIINAPTGAGKTTALLSFIKKLRKTKSDKIVRHVIIVPTISIAKQIEEKDSEIEVIYSSTNKESVETRLKNSIAWKEGDLVLTHATFKTHMKYFEDINDDRNEFRLYFDEAHKIICTNENEISIISAINQEKLTNCFMMSATTFKLEKLMPTTKVINVSVKKKYDITLDVFDGATKRSNFIKIISEKLKEHKKILVHLQDKARADVIVKEFKPLNCYVYNSKVKEVAVHNELFDKSDWDIVICTGSLTEGVSIRDDYYSLFLCTNFDNFDSIQQFVARNRNSKSYGGILVNLKEQYRDKVQETFVDLHMYHLNDNFTNIEVQLNKNYCKQLQNCNYSFLKDSLGAKYKFNKVIEVDEEDMKTKAVKKTKEEKIKEWIETGYCVNFNRTPEGSFLEKVLIGLENKLPDLLEQKSFKEMITKYSIISQGTMTSQDHRKWIVDNLLPQRLDVIKDMRDILVSNINDNVLDKINTNFVKHVGKVFNKKSYIKAVVQEQLLKNKITNYTQKEWELFLEYAGYEIDESKIRDEEGKQVRTYEIIKRG